MGEHIAQLERGIETLQKSAHAFADDEGYSELLRIIRRPGWTTPAELAIFFASIEAMSAQVRELTKFKQELVGAAKQVGVEETVGVG